MKMKFLRSVYNYTLELSKTKYALATLIFVSFFGSTFFPLPTEIIMIPIILAKPSKALFISSVALFSSVIGGMSGYAIGNFLFDSVGKSIIEAFGYNQTFAKFTELYQEWGYWIVFAGGLTPFPYKIICIASGVANMNLFLFIIASLVSRAVRYYFIAYLLYLYGEKAKVFIEKNLEWLSLVAFILLFITIYLLKQIS